jgi:carbon storage regulator
VLVISRKENQRLHISPNVVVTVINLDHGRVQLGIDAPADVIVRREEIMPENAVQEAIRVAKGQK